MPEVKTYLNGALYKNYLERPFFGIIAVVAVSLGFRVLGFGPFLGMIAVMAVTFRNFEKQDFVGNCENRERVTIFATHLSWTSAKRLIPRAPLLSPKP